LWGLSIDVISFYTVQTILSPYTNPIFKKKSFCMRPSLKILWFAEEEEEKK